MKRGILLNIVLLCIFNTVIFAQSNFNNFLESFKEYKWEELIGPSEYLTTQDTINYEYANKNMWHEHRTIRRETKGLSYATSAPHIRIKGGQYAMYHHGFHGLYDNGIKMSDGFVKYNLYTIGKVYLSDSIVLLILKYNYYDPEGGYGSSIEAFTFRLADEQMVSAINLTEIAQTFVEKDMTITSYESYDVLTDDPEYDEGYIRYKCKKVYAIDDDGYFNQILFEEIEKEGALYLAKVNDLDGWTNVREYPNINSDIIYKAIHGKYVYVEKLKDSDWCRILSYKESTDNKKTGGYIHLSRVKKVNM